MYSEWTEFPVDGPNIEFVTSGVELLWCNSTVFPVPVQGILTGGT